MGYPQHRRVKYSTQVQNLVDWGPMNRRLVCEHGNQVQNLVDVTFNWRKIITHSVSSMKNQAAGDYLLAPHAWGNGVCVFPLVAH